jgi:hypothetical protein
MNETQLDVVLTIPDPSRTASPCSKKIIKSPQEHYLVAVSYLILKQGDSLDDSLPEYGRALIA